MTPCPSTWDLIRDWGARMKARCGCCGNASLFEIQMKAGTYTLCSYCDVDVTHRRPA